MAKTLNQAIIDGTITVGGQLFTQVASGHVKSASGLTIEPALSGISALTLTGGTVTASAPLISGTQTWNSGGVSFSAATIDVTDTASASGSKLLDLRVGGSTRFAVSKDGALSLLDTILTRDAANILAQRNGTTGQTMRVYGTYTSATTQTHGYIAGAASSVTFGAEKLSAGVAQRSDVAIKTSSDGAVYAQNSTNSGNARGAYAMDLQNYRGQATHVASGSGSSLLGGSNNLASGWTSSVIGGDANQATANAAIVLGGQDNVASGDQSATVGGRYAKARVAGSVMTGAPQSTGTQIKSNLSTSFQSGHIAFVGVSTTASPTTILTVSMLASQTMACELHLCAQLGDQTKIAYFKRRFVITRNGSNTTALVGSVQTVGTDIGTNSGAPPAGWAVTITADDAAETIKIQGTGEAGAVTWSGRLNVLEAPGTYEF